MTPVIPESAIHEDENSYHDCKGLGEEGEANNDSHQT